MKKLKKNNVVSFPSKLTDAEKEIEAIVFAAAEPLSIDTIESKLSKKADVEKSLLKLQNFYLNKNGKEIKNPFNKFFNNFFSTSGLFVLKK